MTTPTIVSPNPMPSDIDWARVESVLGVRIIQGAPWLGREDDASGSGSAGAVVDTYHRDTTLDAEPVRYSGLSDNLLDGLTRVTEALNDGGDVLVVTQPDLVDAVVKLLAHGSSRSSVAPSTPCASAASSSAPTEGAPEGSDAAGSMSPDSAASCSRGGRCEGRRVA